MHRHALWLLIVMALPAWGQMYKCRAGERILYQATPCPTGSTPLSVVTASPEPDVWSVDEARRRARGEQDQLKELEKKTVEREGVARKQADVDAREAAKRAKECADQLDDIQAAEDKALKAARKKGQHPVEGKQLAKDKAKYLNECGPL